MSNQRKSAKRRLLQQFGAVCGICGGIKPPDELSVGHHRSALQGGTDRLTNSLLLCADCRDKKQGAPMHEVTG